MNLPLLLAATLVVVRGQVEQNELHLSSSDESYLHSVQGFGTEIQCVINTCIQDPTRLRWYKDDKILYSGIDPAATVSPDKIALRHFVTFDSNKDCQQTECNDDMPCADGSHCLENACCPCAAEEFSLVLRNISLSDAGFYRCVFDISATDPEQTAGTQHSLEFELIVLESGLSPDFTSNITFDHRDCCAENKISSQCQDICKPGELETHRFDPMQCGKDDLNVFLHCVTDGGEISHVHCCRMQLVPPFCWDFCSGTMPKLRESHKLCLYWLPEILECYERAYLPFPGPPDRVTVDTVDSSSLQVCWNAPHFSSGGETQVDYYTVHYKEVPRFPFMGSSQGIPFLPSGTNPEESSLPDLFPQGVHGRVKRDELEETEVQLSDQVTGILRRKRQTWVFVTHNVETNETQVREFLFTKINTTDTCSTLDDLRPSTQYFVYVTSTNHYGTSLPSVRAVAATEAVHFNTSLPKIDTCCREQGVTEECIPSLCQLDQTPSAFGAIGIVLQCRTQFQGVAPCLADGRDHTPCCIAKGVRDECLKLCNGSAKYLGLSSVLCLTLDMYTIYGCLREGYETHPSPPRNVTVTDITPTSAVLSWSPPEVNEENVISYSMFWRKDTDDQRDTFHEVRNVSSPHEMFNLDPNTPYMVYILSHTLHGSSLRSTMEEFFTATPEFENACEVDLPLLDVDGAPYLCHSSRPCPPTFKCVSQTNWESKYCCPDPGLSWTTPIPDKVELPDVAACCREKKVQEECVQLCSYNTTVDDLLKHGPKCARSLKDWVECGADGRNHRPCCASAGVPTLCQEFCEPPLGRITKDHLRCIAYVQDIINCGVEGVLKLPGPPRRLEVIELKSDSAILGWEAPSQTTEVAEYMLHLFDHNGQKLMDATATGLTYTFEKLKKDHPYTANVVSHNSHGSSIASNNVTFKLAADSASAEIPSPPHSLKEVWTLATSFNVTWQWSGLMLNNDPVDNYVFKVHSKKEYADRRAFQNETGEVPETKNLWIVLSNLEESTNYMVWVVAQAVGGRQSRPSEAITVATVRDVFPVSPVIQLEPKGPFLEGSKLVINCSVPVGEHVPMPTVTMRFFEETKTGAGHVTIEVNSLTKRHSNVPIVCEATNSDGTSLGSNSRRLKVSHGAHAEAVNNSVSVAWKTSAQLECKVSGYPKPDISWSFGSDGQNVPDSVKPASEIVNAKEADTYLAILRLDSVLSKNAGPYICKACNNISCESAQISLKVQDIVTPDSPDFVVECCRQQGVKKECMPICAKDIETFASNTSCIQELHIYLGCTRDGVDRSACCKTNKEMPEECLSTCDKSLKNKQVTVPEKCIGWQHVLLACFNEPAVVPQPPHNVRVTPAKKAQSVIVSWEQNERDKRMTQLFVVYYKAKDEKKWVKVNISSNATALRIENLNDDARYDLAIMAANYLGFSEASIVQNGFTVGKLDGPSQQIDEASTTDTSGHSTVRTVLMLLLVFLLAAVIILAVIMLTRRSTRWPAFIHKLTNGRTPVTSDSIAFENPGYDREGQIRGLPGDNPSESLNEGADWQNADLEPVDQSESPTPQKGLKYSKLNN